jgi:hypothetical protein
VPKSSSGASKPPYSTDPATWIGGARDPGIGFGEQRCASVELDGKILHPDVGEKLFIPRKTVHRLNCTGSSAVPSVMELAGVAGSIEDFCERVRRGLADATFEQKRKLVELLIDRVIVTSEEVEIRYVIPTDPSSEQVRFCHLRSDYLPNPLVGVANHFGYLSDPQPTCATP